VRLVDLHARKIVHRLKQGQVPFQAEIRDGPRFLGVGVARMVVAISRFA
jgi:hypothetical protein